MPKPKNDIRVTWKTTRPSYMSDYHLFKAHVCYMTTEPAYEGDVPGLRNPRADWGEPLAHLADLVITAQRDARDEDGKWYGFAIDYRDVYAVDLRRAEIMVKGLRAINRKMDKLAEQLGHPRDLATYCAHVAVALGAVGPNVFGQYCDEITPNGTHYRWTDANGLRYALDKVTV